MARNVPGDVLDVVDDDDDDNEDDDDDDVTALHHFQKPSPWSQKQIRRRYRLDGRKQTGTQ